MAWRQTLGESLAPVVDLIYPPRCPSCGKSIAAQSGLCGDCWSTLLIPSQPACATCQRPFGDLDPGKGAQCAPCLADPPLHDGIAAATLYNETSRKLILGFKHGGRIALAEMMARLIAARLPQSEEPPVIVPVPLHRWRLWQRGFNQAALLAQHLAKNGRGDLLLDGLHRKRATRPLGGLGRKQREQALSGAITVKPHMRVKIAQRPIILVDDVLTSGATSNACVRALKTAGARSVTIACFARVLVDGEAGLRPSECTKRNARDPKVPGAT